jgi:hypothetical protein
MLKAKSKEYIARDPALEEGYIKAFKAWLLYGNIPWIIIAFGNLTGLTKSMLEYFAPRQMNPIVLLFHATIIMIWILSIKWIYFQNGVEFLEKHPGIFRNDLKAKQLKWFFPLMLAGGIIAMIMMWVKNPGIPIF